MDTTADTLCLLPLLTLRGADIPDRTALDPA
jgi:hypothetical protein